jgi:Fur family peroxide stress response transcriptional regulator
MSKHTSLLRNDGFKATRQRRAILSVTEELGHATIEELAQRVEKTLPSISLTTIYNNVQLMVKSGVLAEVPVSAKRTAYEIAKQEHLHLVCRCCGKIEDQEIEPDALPKNIGRRNGFLPERMQLIVYGICPLCRKRSNN